MFPGCIVTWAWSLAKGQYMVSWLLTGAPEQRYWQNRETANVGLDSSVGRAPARQSGGHRFKSRSSKFFFVHPNLSKICTQSVSLVVYYMILQNVCKLMNIDISDINVYIFQFSPWKKIIFRTSKSCRLCFFSRSVHQWCQKRNCIFFSESWFNNCGTGTCTCTKHPEMSLCKTCCHFQENIKIKS